VWTLDRITIFLCGGYGIMHENGDSKRENKGSKYEKYLRAHRRRNAARNSVDDPLSEFEAEFYVLLDPGSASGAAMGAFIRRTLRQFNVYSYTEGDILNEVYCRAHKFLKEAGVSIRYPLAWSKRTIYHIIREHSRRERRFSPESAASESKEAMEAARGDEFASDFELLKHAMQVLAPDEEELLVLRVWEEYSWQEIYEILLQMGKVSADGHPKQVQSKLRKQKERILKKLRKQYHALKPLYELGQFNEAKVQDS